MHPTIYPHKNHSLGWGAWQVTQFVVESEALSSDPQYPCRCERIAHTSASSSSTWNGRQRQDNPWKLTSQGFTGVHGRKQHETLHPTRYATKTDFWGYPQTSICSLWHMDASLPCNDFFKVLLELGCNPSTQEASRLLEFKVRMQ